ncbi:MAG: hypothetical protein APF81_21490 [Desulfosporosinus sp. BRH_c37]|nr:MAG: hypothetical protein APF81_21490 [Desulfosporosinus sp. BRH_c37]
MEDENEHLVAILKNLAAVGNGERKTMKIGRTRQSLQQLETWTSPEVQNHDREVHKFVIIPLGSFEQHGPHAPLGTDTFIGWEICQRLASKLNGVTVPPVWFSVSEEHMDFAGTITIKPETFCDYVSDIIFSLARGGFTKILVLNGHGTNETYFPQIYAKVKEGYKGELNLLLLSYWTALPIKEREYLCSLQWGLHANAFETSVILAIFPSLVRKVKNCSHFPDVSGLDVKDLDAIHFRSLLKNSNGVWGDPSKATLRKGQTLLASIEETLSSYVSGAFQLSGTVVTSETPD